MVITMAVSRNRLLEVALFAEVHHNLIGSTIVAQHGAMLIVKRAAPKARATSAATPRKRKPRTNAGSTQAVEAVHGAWRHRSLEGGSKRRWLCS